LIVILYDMILQYISDAQECYCEADIDGFVENTQKARECVGRLMAALDTKYPIALELMQIYVYINKLLITSAIKRSPKDYEAIIRMIHNLSEAFTELSKNDNSAPLMVNAQQVYAGLTYGRESLTESYTTQDTNRGFRI
jgi:flagellar protein FliS